MSAQKQNATTHRMRDRNRFTHLRSVQLNRLLRRNLRTLGANISDPTIAQRWTHQLDEAHQGLTEVGQPYIFRISRYTEALTKVINEVMTQLPDNVRWANWSRDSTEWLGKISTLLPPSLVRRFANFVKQKSPSTPLLAQQILDAHSDLYCLAQPSEEIVQDLKTVMESLSSNPPYLDQVTLKDKLAMGHSKLSNAIKAISMRRVIKAITLRGWIAEGVDHPPPSLDRHDPSP